MSKVEFIGEYEPLTSYQESLQFFSNKLMNTIRNIDGDVNAKLDSLIMVGEVAHRWKKEGHNFNMEILSNANDSAFSFAFPLKNKES